MAGSVGQILETASKYHGTAPNWRALLELWLTALEAEGRAPQFVPGWEKAHAAPEETVLSSGRSDERSRVYRMGVVGWVICSGADPYGDAVPRARFPEVILAEPVIHGGYDVPVAITQIIARATEKDPAQRFQTLGELSDAVFALSRSDQWPGAETVPPIEPSRQRVLDSITTALCDVRSGPGLVVVTGEPGVGKSHMLRHLAVHVADHQCTVIRVYRTDRGIVPYGAIAAVTAALLEHSSEAAALLAQNLSLSAGRLLAAVSSSVARHLPEVARHPSQDSGATNDRVREISRAIGAVLPFLEKSIFLIDDGHSFDEPSRLVLNALLGAGSAVRIVIASRASWPVPEERADRVTHIDLPRLTREEGMAFARRFRMHRDESPWLVDHTRLGEIVELGGGNPLALQLLLAGQENHGEASDQPPPKLSASPAHYERQLAALVHTRLSRESEAFQDVISVLALLSPPVAIEELQADEITAIAGGLRIEEFITRARTLLLIRPTHRSSVQFTHDTIENAARQRGVARPDLVSVAIHLLAEKRTQLTVARLIAAGDLVRSSPLTSLTEDIRDLMRLAVEHALRIGDVDRAYEGSAYVIRVAGTEHHPPDLLPFHLVAHETAARTADPDKMSHHFRAICAAGSEIDRHRARQQWIVRGFGDRRYERSITIGLNLLRLLGCDAAVNPHPETLRHLERRLVRLATRRVRSAILRARPARDDRVELIFSTCALLFPSVVVARPELMPLLVNIMIDTAREHGSHPLIAHAIVQWAILKARSSSHRAVTAALGRDAETIAHRSGDALLASTIEIASIVFLRHWTMPTAGARDQLHVLTTRADRLGNAEWLAHGLHLGTVLAFLAGEPLPDLYTRTRVALERIRELRFWRSETAVRLYLQTMECLLGEAHDTHRLTGTWYQDTRTDSHFRDQGDVLAIWALQFFRATILFYAGRNQEAFRAVRKAWEMPERDHTLPETAAIAYLVAVLGWRTGHTRVATAATRTLRTWAQESPRAVRHRYLMARAERALHYRALRRASYLFRSAVHSAMGLHALPEAAYAAERLATVFDLRSRSGPLPGSRAETWWHTAYTLYQRWGAREAALRVANRLGWSLTSDSWLPAPLSRQPLGTLAVTEGSAMVKQLLEECVSVAMTDECFLFTGLDGSQWYRHAGVSYSRENVTTLDADDLDAEVGELITRAQTKPNTWVESEAAAAYHCHEEPGTTVVVVVRRTVAPVPFSASILTAISERVRVAAMLMSIRTLMGEREHRQQELIVADRLSALGMLAAETAHEVGNPNHIAQLHATALSVQLDQMSEHQEPYASLVESMKDHIRGIDDSLTRISTVVDDILAYARGGTHREPEWIDPDSILQTATRFSQMLVRRYTDRFSVTGLSDALEIHAVPGQLEQALINLIKNACEALPDRDAAVAVWLVYNPERGTVSFCVGDEGIGIAPSIASNEAMPFTTTKQDGTGIGLSVVRSIARRHNGTLSISGSAEYATVAELTVPVRPR